MSSLDSDKSPTPKTATHETIAYYKSQYEQLEAELADFQSSSKELEAELEKDIEAAEARERVLKEKVEALGYEVDEWKVSLAIPELPFRLSYINGSPVDHMLITFPHED